ncbi:unnamed protein product [Phaedon cochleariae]|uniref:MADF domain-containing protein n=1 Tax=Phaedon cochleariae TaxID=80249 RepID=A0A9N9X1U9_PHACE|nr:unnamed protein product [Phaedon cochleariae]
METEAEPISQPYLLSPQGDSNCESPNIFNGSGASQIPDNEVALTAKLAEAVQARPPLWDHTLPLKARGKDVREKLWRQVYEELSQLEKKWNNLKDTSLKHFKTYKPTGSGAESKKKWIHFDLLLAKKNMPRKTMSSDPGPSPGTSSGVSTGPPSEESSVPLSSSGTDKGVETPKTKRRKKMVDESEQLLMDISKEPPPQPTAISVSPALLTIQSVLDKLPTRVRMQAEIEMLNKVYTLFNETVE